MSSGKDWIQLHSGARFRPLAGKGPILLTDIAHSLARLNRFTGHSATYSVAQHSLNVCHVLPPELKLWGLLHDAAEAYLGDVASPVKHRWFMWPLRRAEKKILKRVATQYDLPWPIPREVHTADLRMLSTEAWEFFGSEAIHWQLPDPYENLDLIPSLQSASYWEGEFLGAVDALLWSH